MSAENVGERQLSLFTVGADVQNETIHGASLVLRTHCKRCRRTPRAFCDECQTRVVAFDNTDTCLRSDFLHGVQLDVRQRVDGVTLRIPASEVDGETYSYTSTVAGVIEHTWWLLAAGVGSEELRELRQRENVGKR